MGISLDELSCMLSKKRQHRSCDVKQRVERYLKHLLEEAKEPKSQPNLKADYDDEDSIPDTLEWWEWLYSLAEPIIIK